jgi:membrane protease YdiL (CAAX protease family)
MLANDRSLQPASPPALTPALRFRAAALSLLSLLSACLFLWVAVLGNNLANDWFLHNLPTSSRTVWDLESELFILLIGLAVIAWYPRFFGFKLGDLGRHWKLAAGIFLFCSGGVLTYLLLSPPTPFSGSTFLFEVILVPLGEETLARGIVLFGLLAFLGRIHAPRTALILAVIYSALAFGLAHANNIRINPLAFTLFQVSYAAVFGLLWGWAAARTRSIYPAILMHAAVNLLAIVVK